MMVGIETIYRQQQQIFFYNNSKFIQQHMKLTENIQNENIKPIVPRNGIKYFESDDTGKLLLLDIGQLITIPKWMRFTRICRQTNIITISKSTKY
jgi:hypothetical protein